VIAAGVGEDRAVDTSQDSTPTPDDAAARLYIAVGRLVRVLRRTGTAEVSPGAFSALAALSARGPQRPGDLAAREGVAAPTMTRIVAGLEEAGYVRRAPDPQDGRAVLVDLTEAGAALLVGERSTRSRELRRRVDALPQADRAALVAALSAIEQLGRDGDA
jgi:DNA-binding MarR family transcriptional regulator